MTPPIFLASDTRATLGEGAVLCESRTLLLDRFAHPAAKKDARTAFFEKALAIPALWLKQRAWRQMILLDPRIKPEQLLFGALQNRLLINTSGTVMEKAGLCLDRLMGLPFIPGSALKACARRMALQELSEAATVAAKIEATSKMAWIFGWNQSDWLTKADYISHPNYEAEWASHGPDWALACREMWYDVCHETQLQIWNRICPRDAFSSAGWRRQLGSFEGQAQFLPAYPWEPVANDLELDVAAHHHPARLRRHHSSEPARDIESPLPAVFPATAPGLLFAFVITARECTGAGYRAAEAQASARRWLRNGLATFGIGARTTAGYGWFDTGESLQQTWLGRLRQEQATLQKEREAEIQKQRDAVEREAAAARSEAIKDMTPEELLDYQLSQLTDIQFWGKVQHFAKHLDKYEKAAVLRALLADRFSIWEELKQRARKGGQWAQVEQAIRNTARLFKLGKMP